MEKFTYFSSKVVPLDRANIDTDAIIPKQFLKSIKRTGFGPYLFDEWRYLDKGEPEMDCTNRPLNKEFVLNQPQYKGAQVLLTQQNFGCGSSREHAPWALKDYGFKVILAPSFADIFYNNCFKNGVLPIVLPQETIAELLSLSQNDVLTVSVDLEQQAIELSDGRKILFDISSARKHALINGLDDIGLTLQDAKDIESFEKSYKKTFSWLFQTAS